MTDDPPLPGESAKACEDGRLAGKTVAPGLSLIPMRDDHRPFVANLYTQLREPEFAALGWPETRLAQFLAQQEQAQHGQYRATFPDAEWLIVERGGLPIGRLYVNALPDRLHLVDITLVPDARRAGLGTALISFLIDAAQRSGRFVMLRVELGNSARRLYERLGFRPVADLGGHLEMHATPRIAQVVPNERQIFSASDGME